MKVVHLFCWVMAGVVGTLGGAEVGKPNIVYILADDMGYADAGFLGGKEIKTPAMDALAAKGAVLESFYVQPVCSPTRAALLSGRYAVHTGVYFVVRPGAKWGLPLDERTLPQALREAGYQTAISGKWHLGEFEAGYRPMSRGFEQQYGLWLGAFDYFTHMRDGIRDWHRNDEPSADEGYSTRFDREGGGPGDQGTGCGEAVVFVCSIQCGAWTASSAGQLQGAVW